MSAILDVIEHLLIGAKHPDIVAVERFGPDEGPWGPTVRESKARAITGVRATHQSTATASLWEAIWPGEEPVNTPAVMPLPSRNRGPRLAIRAAQLLDVARPPEFRAWRLVTLPGIGSDEQAGLPFGLSIALAAGGRMLLRSSATGAALGEEPDAEPFPGWVIPAELHA